MTSSSTPNTTQPLVSIILLTWNQHQLTTECLDSLAEMDYPPDRLQIIVCDNGSQDNTPAIIRERYPHVIIIENGDNLGFAAGNNTGVRYALQGSSDYIMLLNNDTVAAPDMLTRLIEVAESDPRIGIVTPKIYYFSEPRKIWCAGAQLDLHTGQGRRLRAEELDDDAAETATEAVHDVDFASGCALCVRREAIEQAGLLEARFFFYFEETEWCVRIARAGYRCVYVPGSHVWHKVSSSIQAGSPRVAYYMTRNRLLFLRMTRPGLGGLPSFSFALGQELMNIIAMSVRAKHRARHAERDARWHGLRDFFRGRFGRMPESHVSTAKG